MTSPCKDCPKRTFTCRYQGACKEYEDFKIMKAAENDWLREQNKSTISEQSARRHWRNIKAGRKSTGGVWR